MRQAKDTGIASGFDFSKLECEMSVSYLRRVEHGAANPTVNELSRIAEALGAEFRNPIHAPELADAAAETQTAPCAGN